MATLDQINPFTPPARVRKREEKNDQQPGKRKDAHDEHAKTRQRPSNDHIVDELA